MNSKKINYDLASSFYPYALKILRESLNFFEENYPDDTHITGLTKNQSIFLYETDVKEETTIGFLMCLDGIPLETIRKVINISNCIHPFMLQRIYYCNEMELTHLGPFCKYVSCIRVALKMHEEGMDKSIIKKYTSLENSILERITGKVVTA